MFNRHDDNAANCIGAREVAASIAMDTRRVGASSGIKIVGLERLAAIMIDCLGPAAGLRHFAHWNRLLLANINVANAMVTHETQLWLRDEPADSKSKDDGIDRHAA